MDHLLDRIRGHFTRGILRGLLGPDFELVEHTDPLKADEPRLPPAIEVIDVEPVHYGVDSVTDSEYPAWCAYVDCRATNLVGHTPAPPGRDGTRLDLGWNP